MKMIGNYSVIIQRLCTQKRRLQIGLKTLVWFCVATWRPVIFGWNMNVVTLVHLHVAIRRGYDHHFCCVSCRPFYGFPPLPSTLPTWRLSSYHMVVVAEHIVGHQICRYWWSVVVSSFLTLPNFTDRLDGFPLVVRLSMLYVWEPSW